MDSRFILPLFTSERQTGKLWIPIFIVFELTRLGIELVSFVSATDAPSNRLLIRFNPLILAQIDMLLMIFCAFANRTSSAHLRQITK